MTASTTRITTSFTAESTAAEVVAGIDLAGRRVIVTGGASGIGIETARALPGAIRTNLQRYITDDELRRMRARMGGTDPIWKTPGQGAATSVLVATYPQLEGIGGRYFEDCNEAEPNQPGSRRGVAGYALDPEAAALLWQISIETLAS